MFRQVKVPYEKCTSLIKNSDFNMIKFYIMILYLIFNFSYISIFGELTLLVKLFNYLFYLAFISIFIYDILKKKLEMDFYTTILTMFLFSTIITMYLNLYSLPEYINEIKFIILGVFQFYIFFNAFNKNSYIKLKILSCVILFICFISHILSIIIYIFRFRFILNKVYGFHFNGAFTGIYDNENILGIICFIGIVFSFVFLSYYKSVVFKQIAIINIVLSLIMLFLVNARSAVIAFLIFSFVFTATMYRKKWMIVFFVLIALIASIYLLFFNQEIFIKLLNGRYEIWEQVLYLIKDSVFFGYSKTDSINTLINSTIRFLSGAKEGGTHNSFLDILLSYGTIGFILFSTFVLGYIIKTYKILMKNIGNYNYIVLYSGVLSFLFIGMFESVLVYTPSLIGIIFWLILGYVKNDPAKNQ